MTTSLNTSIATCPSCHIGHLCEARSTYTKWHDGELIVVPNVPSQVCDYCGEIRFHPVVLERLHQLLLAEVGPPGDGTAAQHNTHTLLA